MTFPRGDLNGTFHCEQDDGFYTLDYKYQMPDKMLLSAIENIEERSFIRKSCKWWHQQGYFIDGVDVKLGSHRVVLRKNWKDDIKVVAAPGYFDIDS